MTSPVHVAVNQDQTRAAFRLFHVLPELEQLYLNDLMQTHDAAEGIAAFLEKRVPKSTDR